MDVSDELQVSDKSSSVSSYHNVSSSAEHAIPGMVITSTEDSSKKKNISECTIVLIPPTNDHSNGTSDKGTSAEFAESANSVPEERPVVDFEDISVVVRDVVSRCAESVSHSVRQRPLVMELEKGAPQQETSKDSSSKCPPPPPPPPPPVSVSPVESPQLLPSSVPNSITAVTSPAVTTSTAMQRPLVFDATAPRTDHVPEVQKDTSMNQAMNIKEELICDRAYQGMQDTSDEHVESFKPSEDLSATKKEGLPSVKKFFDSMLHHETREPIVNPDSPELSMEPVSPSESKSEKKGFKKFFQSSKTDAPKSESTSPTKESTTKESTSFAQGAKQNIKSFIGSIKHEPADRKSSPDLYIERDQSTVEVETGEVVPSSPTKSPKEPKSFASDTKQNIKAFFDTFKHEHGEQKLSDKNIMPPSSVDTNNENTPEILPLESPKESSSFVKDTKENIKSLFDSFKHEHINPKSKTNISKISVSQPNITPDIDIEQNLSSSVPGSPKDVAESSFMKDTKENIKSFFDNLKHDPSSIKNKDSSCKKSASQPDFSKESTEFNSSLEDSLGTSKHKDQTVTKVVSIKDGASSKLSEDSKQLAELNKLPDDSTSVNKDTKQNVKTFFDNFKLGDTNKEMKKKEAQQQKSVVPEPGLQTDSTKEPTTATKGTKQNVKTFFDNFKLGDLNSDLRKKESISKKTAISEPELHKESTDNAVIFHKEGKNPVKKYFSFSQAGENKKPDISDSLDSQISQKSVKSKPTKTAKSVKLDLFPTFSDGSEKISASFSHMNGDETEVINETKQRAQSVPSDPTRSKFIETFPETKPETSTSQIESSKSKQAEHKGSHQSIKKFFHSFKHEKSDSDKSVSHQKETTKDFSSTDVPAIDDSKTSEKPVKEKKNKSIRRSLSDKISREEVVQNFKGFFDSIGHKSSSKTSAVDNEHIYDVVEVKPEADKPISETTNTSGKTTSVKSESQGMKKILTPFFSKEAPASGSGNIFIADNNAKIKRDQQDGSDFSKGAKSSTTIETEVGNLSPVNKPGSPKPEKGVFNAIGENIIALKDKMLTPKEKRKIELHENPVLVAHADEVAETKREKSEITPLPSVKDSYNEGKKSKMKPIPPEKPVHVKELSKPQIPKSDKDVEATAKSTEKPNSLYETCCMKIAVLLRDKALDIVSEHTKSPPPKPPKPSAEAVARARAAAVSRRIETQKMSRSIGENFPIGCNNMRFADDETESSCDYKDVENFDYIMDYELINRYKVDSSKLDTFSVPSTCSGLTSYYTADSIMETISLSSDVSFNPKQILTSSKSEPKIPTKEDTKKSKPSKIAPISKDITGSKQPSKKIPPPIPPKPVLIQNISKIKGETDGKTVSNCVNGLSLSPRLSNKFSKDSVVTQKRPLMIADLKETQFSSLQHPKKPKKPARNFDAVLRNESLKKVPCVSSDKISSTAVSVKDLSLQSSHKAEKRTISPPRPPPPNIAKKLEKPPKPERPPPPAKPPKSPELNEISEAKSEISDVIEKLEEVAKSVEAKEQDVSGELSFPGGSPETFLQSDKNKLSESSCLGSIHDIEKTQNSSSIVSKSGNSDFKVNEDNLNNNFEVDKGIADSLNNNLQMNDNNLENPKPPPRNRRIRSRTVEIVPAEKQEERLKRSQSLSEIDVEKRVTFLEAEKAKIDSKSIYTTVNKNNKKSNLQKTSQSSPDLVSCRPLPAPPPPPRRFRSLERKAKPEKSFNEPKLEQSINITEETVILQPSEIKAPVRRKKSDKERFLSLHIDSRGINDVTSESPERSSSLPCKPDRQFKSLQHRKYDVNANISDLDTQQNSLSSSNQNIPSSDTTDSMKRNNPKNKKEGESRKRSLSNWYDEVELVEDAWEMVDQPPPEEADEYNKSPIAPLRRKSESKRKSRETSKFYVNMDDTSMSSINEDKLSPSPAPSVDTGRPSLPSVDKAASPLPLVDKETSPLPLDCSEKSVQTSLETLSHGIVSRDDDQSEDTDELLDLAQTLQKELSVIINRHKSVNESSEDLQTPPLSAATSEKNLNEDFKEGKKISSVRSSTSEVWPITSSDESDVEGAADSSNISEISIRKKKKKIFYIAQEIMTSEEAFVDALKLLNVDFKGAVESANQQKNLSVIPDETLAQILNHLPQLQHLNENLLMELKDRIDNWDKHEKIADIIVKMGPFLKLYSWYIQDFESNVSLLEESKKKYPAFCQILKEFEMSARCKRLALSHYMLKPIQRIPQYRLLLQEYLHHLTEDSKDYQDTVTALQIVSEVANHANESMKQGDNAQKLISIQNSIMGHKEIVKPGRVFVKEGELMKLSRKGMQPRWFVLLNDLLLYLTPVQQGLYRVNHELPLAGMKVAIPIQQDYQNEFSIISVTRSFTLAAKSPEERQEWIIALTKAIEENMSKRKTFSNSKLLQKAHDRTSSEDEGAFVLGKKAPVWIPDARVTMCQLCTSEFTVTFRRHHCRACGKVICSICSSHRISLPYLGNRIARVCDECHMRLVQDSSACTESGETDSDNQQIAVKSHLRTDNRYIKKHKRSLPSVLKEVCANDQGSTISGYLHKKSGKNWKRDWFVVKDKVLYEYRASEDVAALRSTPLLGYEIEQFNEAYEGVDASLLFQLAHPGQAPIIFYADTVGSAERWISALKTATILE